jgi:hypothetical protein
MKTHFSLLFPVIRSVILLATASLFISCSTVRDNPVQVGQTTVSQSKWTEAPAAPPPTQWTHIQGMLGLWD